MRSQGWARCGIVIKRWRDLRSTKVQAIQPDVVFINYRKIPANAELDSLNFELVIYEIDEPALAKSWLAKGASKVESFDIGRLIGYENQ